MRNVVLVVGALVLASGLTTVAYLGLLASVFASPHPTKTFASNRSTFELIANRVINGVHVNGADYEAADRRLQGAGVSNIRKRGKCLGFYLASLPPDANYEILYAPDGFRDLPVGEVAGPPNKLLELKRLGSDYHWYYWIVY